MQVRLNEDIVSSANKGAVIAKKGEFVGILSNSKRYAKDGLLIVEKGGSKFFIKSSKVDVDENKLKDFLK